MKERFPLFAIFAISLLLYRSLIFILPPVQLVKYWHAASLLLLGQLNRERILDFSPLYLYLNVLIQKVNGSQEILLWFQILCIAISSCLVFLILKSFFRGVIAMLGVTAFLFDRGLMIFTHTFEPEAAVILCSIGVVYFLLQQSTRSALLAGICFGLGLLTRPNFMPVLFIVPIHFLLNSMASAWRKKTILFLIPVLICLSCAWIRNQNILGYFTPFVMDPGTNLHDGNNPNSWGMGSIYPPVLNQLSESYSAQPDYHHQLYRDFARRITGKNLTLPEVNSYWSNKVLRFLIDNPSHSFRLITTKIFHVFHAFQWHDLASSYAADITLQHNWLPQTPFAVVSALALIGLLLLSRHWKQYLIFYGFFFSQFFVMVAMYVSARQRVSILFFFIFFACGALQFIFSNRIRLLVLVAVIPLFFLLQTKTDFMREEEHLWNNTLLSKHEVSEAYRFRNEGRFHDAAAKSSSALALTPWFLDSRRPANLNYVPGYIESAFAFERSFDPASQMDLAFLLLENGEAGKARIIFDQLLKSGYRLKRDDQQSSNLHFYLARCAWIVGQKQKAVEHLKQAIHESPGDPWILSYLTALTGENSFRTQIYSYFDDVDAAFFLGKAYLETNQPEESAKYFQYVVRIFPEFRKAYIYLAAALGNAGHYAEAAQIYRKAIQMRPDPVFLEKEILNIFRELAKTDGTALAQYSFGIVLRQFGYYEEALLQQEKAKNLDPSNQEISAEISMLKKVIRILQDSGDTKRNTN